MTFTLETWKEKTAERLHNTGDWLDRRRSQDAPYLLYGALCGMSLWPLVAAAPTFPGGTNRQHGSNEL